MLRSLLVPLDGSRFSEHGLAWAEAVARLSHAHLHLVRVHVPEPRRPMLAEGMPALLERADAGRRAEETSYLEAVRGRLEAHLPVSARLLEGPIAPALAAHAVAAGVDLIVIASHGLGGLERFWMGSVTDALVRTSPVPLLVTRPREDATPGPVAPPRRILVPLDGSCLAEQALFAATSLAELGAAEFALVHVTEPMGWAGRIPGGDRIASAAVEAGAQGDAQAEGYLSLVAHRLREQGFAARTRVLVSTHIARAILEEARAEKADMIAMATHGRGGVSRLMLGSIADKVMRRGEVPLLLHRPRTVDLRTGERTANARAEARDAAQPDYYFVEAGAGPEATRH